MKFKNPVSVVSPVDGEHAANKDYVDDKMVTKTWDEYQALSEEEKNNGTLYDIPDMPTAGQGGIITTYTALAQLGLDTNTTHTVGEIYMALPSDSIFLYQITGTTRILDCPSDYGLLLIQKGQNNRFSITFKVSTGQSVSDNKLYLGQLKGNDGTGLTWDKVCTTSVPDVPKTQLGLTLPSTLTVGENGMRIQYMVVDGVCEMSVYAHLSANAFTGYSTIGTGMPKPMLEEAVVDILPTDSRNPYFKCSVTSSGELRILITEEFPGVGAYWTGTLRYKVAEDWRP